ncbi:MAG: hypothetical protein Q9227_002478 [Pyrenula ochraceoflavens]
MVAGVTETGEIVVDLTGMFPSSPRKKSKTGFRTSANGVIEVHINLRVELGAEPGHMKVIALHNRRRVGNATIKMNSSFDRRGGQSADTEPKSYGLRDMNDATPSSSSQAAIASDSTEAQNEPPPETEYVSTLFSHQPDPSTTATSSTPLQAFKRKRLELLDDFLQQLDILIFIQFSILYYYDCSFSNFLLRVSVQTVFLAPRSIPFPETPFQRPYIGAIIGGNLICMISHILRPRPEAGEITEGYLHGGLFVDFVGEKGPIWKSRLIAMDLLILVLQLIMLAGLVEKLSAKAAMSGVTAQGLRSTQDHDAEERGVFRTADDRPAEPDSLGASTSANVANAFTGHVLDPHYRGDSMVGELDVLRTIQRQWQVWQDSATSTVTTSQANTAPRNDITTLFGGLLGVRLRVRGRTIGL